MLRPLVLALAAAGALTASLVHATELIAIGSLGASSAGANADLSGLTAPLENGIAGNLLGGLGSGFAWAGGNTFLAVPDRGPNATQFNPLIDDTTSYISRFQTIGFNLTPNAAPGGLAFTLSPTLLATTLLSSATALSYGSGALGTDATHTLGSGVPALNASNHTNYFTGRSDGFAAGGSTNPNNARLDPEGVRVSNDGKSVFISDEYGPYVYQFDRATGQRIRAFALPAALTVATPGPTTVSEGAPTNTTGRVANKGMEGLAITPDGKTLVGVMQAPLLQDSHNVVRIVTIDIATGATKQFAYQLTDGSGVSEITAVNDHVFLVDERDGKGLGDGSSASVKKLYKIDLNDVAAKEITGQSGDLSAFAVPKTEFLDIRKTLVNAGVGLTNQLVPAKIEGIAFGDDISLNGVSFHTLWITNDNDFVAGVAGPSQFFVYAVSDADLGTTFQAQAIAAVPEPQTYALLLAGFAGMAWLARRRRS
jgi:Esterase-like activity of phytase/PEP-CTERM motif